VWAAFVDWSIGRALTRSAIFMPKSPLVILIYRGLGLIGQLAATACGLLVLVTLVWLAWVYLRNGKSLALPLNLVSLAILNLLFLFVPPSNGLLAGFYTNLILAIAWLGWQSLRAAVEIEKKIAVALVALALLSGAIYLLIPAMYGALRLPGPPGYSGKLFNLGELLVVLAAVSLGGAYGRSASRRAWSLSVIPALGFTALHLANPAIAGILSIWSIGLSLYLPWPVYALGLWSAALALLSGFERREPVGWAILLLVAGGFTPQLTSQAFLGIASLALFLPLAKDSEERIRSLPPGQVLMGREFHHPV
jgi:hypothetical protein